MPSFTRHERELQRRLRDSSTWPAFLNPAFAERLERAGLRALQRRSTDADVTAIVIFHQLTEQMLRVLIADTQFLISVSVLPARVSFSNPPRQTFGQVMALLRSGVEFSKKKRLLELAGSLNDIRNGVAHKLLQRGSFSGLRRDAQKSLRLYERTFSIFDEAHDDFRVTFSAIAKDLM